MGLEIATIISIISISVTAVSTALNFLLRPGEPDPGSPQSYQLSDSGKGIPVIYGRAKVNGLVAFADEQKTKKRSAFNRAVWEQAVMSQFIDAGTLRQDALETSDKYALQMSQHVFCVTNGEIGGYETLRVDNKSSLDEDKWKQFRVKYGTPGMAETLVSDFSPNRGKDAVFTGLQFLSAICEQRPIKNPQWFGYPRFSAYMRGEAVRSLIKSGQPGSEMYTFSNMREYSPNVIRCLLDYVTNRVYGMGLSDNEINLEKFYLAQEYYGQKVQGKGSILWNEQYPTACNRQHGTSYLTWGQALRDVGIMSDEDTGLAGRGETIVNADGEEETEKYWKNLPEFLLRGEFNGQLDTHRKFRDNLQRFQEAAPGLYIFSDENGKLTCSFPDAEEANNIQYTVPGKNEDGAVYEWTSGEINDLLRIGNYVFYVERNNILRQSLNNFLNNFDPDTNLGTATAENIVIDPVVGSGAGPIATDGVSIFQPELTFSRIQKFINASQNVFRHTDPVDRSRFVMYAPLTIGGEDVVYQNFTRATASSRQHSVISIAISNGSLYALNLASEVWKVSLSSLTDVTEQIASTVIARTAMTKLLSKTDLDASYAGFFTSITARDGGGFYLTDLEGKIYSFVDDADYAFTKIRDGYKVEEFTLEHTFDANDFIRTPFIEMDTNFFMGLEFRKQEGINTVTYDKIFYVPKDEKYDISYDDWSGISQFTLAKDNILSGDDIVEDSINTEKKPNQLVLEFDSAAKGMEKESVVFPPNNSPFHNSMLQQDGNHHHQSRFSLYGTADIFHANSIAANFLITSRRRAWNVSIGPEGGLIQLGDIGTLLDSETGLRALVRVIEKTTSFRLRTITLSVQEYHPCDYEWLPHAAEISVPSIKTPIINPPSNVLLFQHSNDRLRTTWDAAEPGDLGELITRYEIAATFDGGTNWDSLGIISADSALEYEFFNHLSTTMSIRARVRSISENNLFSDWVESSEVMTIVPPPDDVEVGLITIDRFKTTWDHPYQDINTDSDPGNDIVYDANTLLDHYEVERQFDTSGWKHVANVPVEEPLEAQFQKDGDAQKVQTRARSVTELGHKSSWKESSQNDVGLAPPDEVKIEHFTLQTFLISWEAPDGLDTLIDRYEIAIEYDMDGKWTHVDMIHKDQPYEVAVPRKADAENVRCRIRSLSELSLESSWTVSASLTIENLFTKYIAAVPNITDIDESSFMGQYANSGMNPLLQMPAGLSPERPFIAIAAPKESLHFVSVPVLFAGTTMENMISRFEKTDKTVTFASQEFEVWVMDAMPQFFISRFFMYFNNKEPKFCLFAKLSKKLGVSIGDTIQTMVEGAGTLPVTYIWQERATDINGRELFIFDLTNTNSASLTIGRGHGLRQVRCIAYTDREVAYTEWSNEIELAKIEHSKVILVNDKLTLGTAAAAGTLDAQKWQRSKFPSLGTWESLDDETNSEYLTILDDEGFFFRAELVFSGDATKYYTKYTRDFVRGGLEDVDAYLRKRFWAGTHPIASGAFAELSKGAGFEPLHDRVRQISIAYISSTGFRGVADFSLDSVPEDEANAAVAEIILDKQLKVKLEKTMKSQQVVTGVSVSGGNGSPANANVQTGMVSFISDVVLKTEKNKVAATDNELEIKLWDDLKVWRKGKDETKCVVRNGADTALSVKAIWVNESPARHGMITTSGPSTGGGVAPPPRPSPEILYMLSGRADAGPITLWSIDANETDAGRALTKVRDVYNNSTSNAKFCKDGNDWYMLHPALNGITKLTLNPADDSQNKYGYFTQKGGGRAGITLSGISYGIFAEANRLYLKSDAVSFEYVYTVNFNNAASQHQNVRIAITPGVKYGPADNCALVGSNLYLIDKVSHKVQRVQNVLDATNRSAMENLGTLDGVTGTIVSVGSVGTNIYIATSSNVYRVSQSDIDGSNSGDDVAVTSIIEPTTHNNLFLDILGVDG